MVGVLRGGKRWHPNNFGEGASKRDLDISKHRSPLLHFTGGCTRIRSEEEEEEEEGEKEEERMEEWRGIRQEKGGRFREQGRAEKSQRR